MTLNASAENGAFGSASRVISSAVPGTRPTAGSTSSGEGSRSMTASSRGWTPLFLKDDPHSTGVMEMAEHRRADGRDEPVLVDLLALEVGVGELVVVVGEATEISSSRAASAAARISSGISVTSNSVPRSSL